MMRDDYSFKKEKFSIKRNISFILKFVFPPGEAEMPAGPDTVDYV